MGKKSWLFKGHAGAGQRGAILYTLIENCSAWASIPKPTYATSSPACRVITNWQVKVPTPAAWAKARGLLPQARRLAA